MVETTAPRRYRGMTGAADWLAPPVTLAVPYVHFLRYYEYGLTRPESLIFLSIIIAVGLAFALIYRRGGWAKVLTGALLITLFIEAKFPFAVSHIGWFVLAFAGTVILCQLLRTHLSAIQLAVFGTILITTIVLPVESLSPVERTAEAAPPNTALPVIVHLILDEHAGVEAIPEEIPGGSALRQELAQAYVNSGFRLFGRAYSEYFYSKNSLSHVVNLAAGPSPELTTDRRGIYEVSVTENSYFREMARRGYRITVYQADYMDFCSGADASPWRCHTYRPFQLKPVAEGPWPISTKLNTVAGFYLMQSSFYETVRQSYYVIRAGAERIGLALPAWDWELTRLPALEVMNLLDRLEKDLVGSHGGELFFVHALLPHSPYAYNSDCSIVPPDRWLERRNRVLHLAQSNTPEMRRKRYEAYVGQVRCLNRRLGRLFRAADAQAPGVQTIFIIHGDHGSRINIFDPRERHRDSLTDDDFIDNYATLLAIRGPDIPGCYDSRPVSVQDLFADLAASNFSWPPKNDPFGQQPVVYLASDLNKDVDISVPMISFGTGQPPPGIPACGRP